MNWMAVVPLKKKAGRKSRLADILSEEQRIALSDAMACHVVSCLEACPSISEVWTLSPEPWEDSPWLRDMGRGLNEELCIVRGEAIHRRLLVIHADLPAVTVDDVEYLLAQAGSGMALASDRHRKGTNAIALARPRPFRFAFGADSRERHVEAARGELTIVERPGLALDVDTAEDLRVIRAMGSRRPMRPGVHGDHRPACPREKLLLF